MGASHAWVFLAFLVANALAQGKGNVTVTQHGDLTFGSEPHGRGTVSIFISCTATFIFCIWTAVHPNIIPGVTDRKRVYYKAVMMVLSIIVPEGVLICAIGQWREAKRLQKAWITYFDGKERKLLRLVEDSEDEQDLNDKIKRWAKKSKKVMTMQVAFFVVMGGLVVDEATDVTSNDRAEPTKSRKVKNAIRSLTFRKTKEPSFRGPYRAILTPTGFTKYLKKGLIHEMTFHKASIKDKCKASWFAKTLAGLQALWLLVDCAARLGAGLPLTLLEVHVIIHVVRTTLIYAFWWSKPLDVNEPIKIKLRKSRLEKDREFTIYNVIKRLSPNSDSKPDGANVVHPTPPERKKTELRESNLSGSLAERSPQRVNTVKFSVDPYVQEISGASNPLPQAAEETQFGILEEPITRLLDGERLQAAIESSKEYSPNEPNYVTKQSPNNFVQFHSQATYDIIIQLDVGERTGRQEIGEASGIFSKSKLERTGSGSKPGETSTEKKQRKKEGLRFSFSLFGEALLICLTGALHGAAWHNKFPSEIEAWLWRGSALAMCFCCLGLFLIANFTEYEQDLIASIWRFHLSSYGFREFFRKVWEEIDGVCAKHAGLKPTTKQPTRPVDEESANPVSKTPFTSEQKEIQSPGGKVVAGSTAAERASAWRKYCLHQLGIWTAFFFVIVYFFSVAFITVESYLSLRDPPKGTFHTASWTDYWPHL